MNGYLLYIYIQKYFGYHEFKGHVSTIYERTPLTGQYNILIKLAAGIRGYKKKFDCVRVRWHIKGQAVARKMRLPIKCQKNTIFSICIENCFEGYISIPDVHYVSPQLDRSFPSILPPVF